MKELQDSYKDTKIGRIPKDWEVKTLEDVFIFNNGKGHEQFISENGDYIVVNSKFISQEGRVKKFSNKQMSPLLVKDITMVMSDIPNGRALAKCFLIEENNKYSLNQRICGLRLKNDANDDVRFFFYTLNRNKGFLKYNDGVSQTNLRKSEVLGCLLAYPPSNEQKKIADILSTVDEQMSTTDKIIEKSKELKKGLMQKLFSEGIGHNEFKDTKIGRIPEDWEIKQLATICDIVMGQSPSSESYNENDTGLPLVQGNADIKSRITKPRIYTSQITKISEVDDIIMTVRAPVGAIAKSNIKSCIGRGICALRVKSIDNEFLYQMLIEKETSWIRLEQGSTFSAVNSKDIKTFKIALPPLLEQQKIAAILSEADAKIEKEQSQKAQLEQLKKGLMQQLLTGKKRVTV
jgi:type I restriction enzyme, S subunit